MDTPTLGEPRCNAAPIVRAQDGTILIQPNDALNPNLYTPEQLDSFGHAHTPRDFDGEFLRGTAQIFRNELAAVSWNLAMFAIVGSGCADPADSLNDPRCFDTKRPYALDRCSFSQPQHCGTSQSYLEWINVPEPPASLLAVSALVSLGALVDRRRKQKRRFRDPTRR